MSDASLADQAGTLSLLDDVLTAVPCGVWVIDADGDTVVVNEAMAILVETDRARLRAVSVLRFFEPAATQVLRRMLRLRAAGESGDYELPLRLGNGTMRLLRVSGKPRFDASGAVVGAIATCVDATAEVVGKHAAAAADLLVGFTPRQRQLVDGLLRGDRVPQIARELEISQSTARNHLSPVYRKLGVRSQQELIAMFRSFDG